MGLGSRTIGELADFSQALLPTLAAATAASGAVTTATVQPVSYTHLDVYKRQLRHPCKPPRGPAAGGPGDVGRGQCGGEIERNARVQKDTGVFHSQAPFQLQDQLHNPGAQGQAGGLDGPEHWPCLLYTSRCV